MTTRRRNPAPAVIPSPPASSKEGRTASTAGSSWLPQLVKSASTKKYHDIFNMVSRGQCGSRRWDAYARPPWGALLLLGARGASGSAKGAFAVVLARLASARGFLRPRGLPFRLCGKRLQGRWGWGLWGCGHGALGDLCALQRCAWSGSVDACCCCRSCCPCCSSLASTSLCASLTRRSSPRWCWATLLWTFSGCSSTRDACAGELVIYRARRRKVDASRPVPTGSGWTAACSCAASFGLFASLMPPRHPASCSRALDFPSPLLRAAQEKFCCTTLPWSWEP